MKTREILSNVTSGKAMEKYEFWESQPKRDDLSDSFLQGLVYIYKNHIKTGRKNLPPDEIVYCFTFN